MLGESFQETLEGLDETSTRNVAPLPPRGTAREVGGGRWLRPPTPAHSL